MKKQFYLGQFNQRWTIYPVALIKPPQNYTIDDFRSWIYDANCRVSERITKHIERTNK